MSRRRAWVGRSAPAVLALFVGTSALPRAGVYHHHHVGGEHAHVHAWGEDVVEHHHDDEQHHDHGPQPGRPGLEDADDGPLDHVHWQPPFQRAAPPPTTGIVRITTLASFAPPLHLRRGAAAAVPPSARGPPLPPLPDQHA